MNALFVAKYNLLTYFYGAAFNSAHTDSAEIIVIIKAGKKELQGAIHIALGGVDVFKNGIEEGAHISLPHVRVKRRITVATGSEYNGEFNLIVIGAEFDKQIENLVNNLHGSCAGAVDFVDNNNGFFAESQRLFQNKTRLGHTAFKGVNKQKNAVNHHHNTLNLTAEVSVTGSVNNVDFYTLVMNTRIF